MSRRKRQHKGPPRPSSPPSRTGRASRRLAWVGGIILFALLVALAIPFLRPATAEPPVVSLEGLEAGVREAIERHQQAVRTAPRSGEAWGWLGAILHAYRFEDAADACLQQAKRLDPKNPRWPYFRSMIWTARDPAVAREEARLASERAGNRPPFIRYYHAKLIAEEGRWEEARARLLEVVQAEPDYAPALLLLAQDALVHGDMDQAAQWAGRCTSNPTTGRAAWSLLAQVHQRRGDPDAAARASQQAASLPDDYQPWDPFLDELSSRRGDPRALGIHCHTLLATGQLDLARPIIAHLLKSYPDQAETWLLDGRLKLLVQQPAAAESSLQRHVQLQPDSTQGWFQLGTAFLRQGKSLEAAQAFAQATSYKPDFGPAWFNRGLALGQTGDLQASLDSFNECLRHNPEKVEAYLFLADLHVRMGQPDHARARLDEAEALAPGDPRIHDFRRRLGP